MSRKLGFAIMTTTTVLIMMVWFILAQPDLWRWIVLLTVASFSAGTCAQEAWDKEMSDGGK